MIEDGKYTLVSALFSIVAVLVCSFCMNADPLSELISDGIPNLGITYLVRNLITVPAP